MTDTPQRPMVMLVTRNLPPLVGGMERLLQEAAKGLAEYTELTVIGPRGCGDFLPDNVRVGEVPPGLAGFLITSLWKAIPLCRQQHFDIVIGGSGLAGPCLALLKRLFRVKTAIFLHGLDLIVPNLAYQKLFVPAIRRADVLLANSRNTAHLAREKRVDAERIHVINPGCHPPDETAHDRVEAFRQQHQLPNGPMMLFVGRMTRRKGLSLFISQCLPQVLEAVPDATLVIVGDQPTNALNGEGEKQDVMRNLSQLPPALRERVRFLGSLDDDDLNTCYAAADVHVFPIQDIPGDVEGFGMVAIEAASYGTPTVAFGVGGVADAVGTEGGELVTADDYLELAQAVIRSLQSAGCGREQCHAHAVQFSWERFNRELKTILFGKHIESAST